MSTALTTDELPGSRVRTFINDALGSILDDLVRVDGRPSITLRRRPKTGECNINPENGALEAPPRQGAFITYSWPGKTVREAWRFAILIRILSLIYEAIQGDSVISKRDIYYNDPICFGSQRIVDTLVDDIAYTIGVNRAALHVTAVAKGLTVGDFRLKMKDQSWYDVGSSLEDILIPQLEDAKGIEFGDIKWVLVIEKEAIFRKLVGSHYYMNSAAGKGILITGKGYPDLCTRAFVRRLSDTTQCSRDSTNDSQKPRLYVLVDCDPDGMAIMSIYKYGSTAQSHENANLNAQTLRWLGLRTSDMVGEADPQGDDPLIPLTTRDRKRALNMLKNDPAFAENGPQIDWRAELQQMLMLNLKAELEVLYGREGGIRSWLDQRLK